jgi:hypothetical protein
MSTPLPEEGADRTLFLRALREYSNACEPPALTPGCPYFRVDPSIGPWCAEECIDVLGRYPDEPTGVVLDGSLKAVRLSRRPRRPPSHQRPPFDATQQHLEDRGREPADRRPASLLHRLRELTHAPAAGEDVLATMMEIETILAELERRGVNSKRLYRSVLLQELSRIIVIECALPVLPASFADEEDDPAALDAAWQSISGWPEAILHEVLDGDVSPRRLREEAARNGPDWAIDQFLRAMFETGPAVHSWLLNLDLEQLTVRLPPTPQQLEALRSQVPAAPTEDDLWFVDRFGQTYLADWQPASLLWEFRYQLGECEPLCDTDSMQSRPVHLPDLALAIAHNAASDITGRRDEMRTADRLVMPALRHLEEGKPEIAAGIFDAQRRAFPDDARAHNNFGFCSMPLDLRAALSALEEAASLGLNLEPVNVANRMLVLREHGRPTTALALADRFVESSAWERPAPGYLWDHKAAPGDWSLTLADCRQSIAEMAAAMSAAVGDDAATAVWTRRLTEL